MVVLLAFVFATFLILAKLAWMAAFAEPAGRGDGAGGIAPARADIVDRNGVTLARSIDAWSIAVHPGKILSDPRVRSEEHTSELQSLMRISYAVFCLKKKKNITNED